MNAGETNKALRVILLYSSYFSLFVHYSFHAPGR